jgi:hypothetical protein
MPIFHPGVIWNQADFASRFLVLVYPLGDPAENDSTVVVDAQSDTIARFVPGSVCRFVTLRQAPSSAVDTHDHSMIIDS